MGLITRLSNPNKTAGVEPVQEQPFSKRVNWTNQQGIENTRRIQQKQSEKEKERKRKRESLDSNKFGTCRMSMGPLHQFRRKRR
jgi:hypothetical protein